MTGESGSTLQESYDLEVRVRQSIHEISVLSASVECLLQRVSTLSFLSHQERFKALCIIYLGWMVALKMHYENISSIPIDGR